MAKSYSDIIDAISSPTLESGSTTGAYASIYLAFSDATQSEKDRAGSAWTMDGTEDDVQFQAALNQLTSGGSIEFSSGTGYGSTYVTIPASLPFLIKGQGKGVSMWSFSKGDLSDSSRQFLTNYNGTDRNDVTHLTIRDLTFVDDDSDTANQSWGIGIGNADADSSNEDITVEDCEFDHCGCRICNVNTGQAAFQDNYVHDIADDATTDAGIMMYYNDSHSVVEGNIIDTIYKMGIAVTGCANVKIHDNHIHDSAGGGSGYCIGTDTCYRLTITDNTCDSSRGILSEDDYGQIVITGNQCLGGSSAIGIGVWNNGDRSPYQVIVANNTVEGFDYNIELDSVTNAQVIGNTCRYAASHGILVKDDQSVTPRKTIIAFNDIFAWSYSTANDSGLYITLDNVEVYGNNIDGDSDGHGGGAKGIRGNAGSQANVHIYDNNISGCHSAAFVLYEIGTGARIERNTGYATEADGTSSIASGATTATVTHGLATTPTVINITFAEQGSNDYGRWWISSVGATTFQVNVSADPGASNLDFWWEAKVR